MPKSKHQIPGRVRTAYEFIKAHRNQYSVQMMCRVLEVAPDDREAQAAVRRAGVRLNDISTSDDLATALVDMVRRSRQPRR